MFNAPATHKHPVKPTIAEVRALSCRGGATATYEGWSQQSCRGKCSALDGLLRPSRRMITSAIFELISAVLDRDARLYGAVLASKT